MTSSHAESSSSPRRISSAWSQKQSTRSGSNCVPRRSVATATAAAGAARVVEGLDVVGEVHQADRRRHLVGAGPAGHALAVPALERLDAAGCAPPRRGRAGRRSRSPPGSAAPSPAAPTGPPSRGTVRPCRPGAAATRRGRGGGRRTSPWPSASGHRRGCRRRAPSSSPKRSASSLVSVAQPTHVSSDV